MPQARMIYSLSQQDRMSRESSQTGTMKMILQLLMDHPLRMIASLRPHHTEINFSYNRRYKNCRMRIHSYKRQSKQSQIQSANSSRPSTLLSISLRRNQLKLRLLLHRHLLTSLTGRQTCSQKTNLLRGKSQSLRRDSTIIRIRKTSSFSSCSRFRTKGSLLMKSMRKKESRISQPPDSQRSWEKSKLFSITRVV